jgi:hypothetical protein
VEDEIQNAITGLRARVDLDVTPGSVDPNSLRLLTKNLQRPDRKASYRRYLTAFTACLRALNDASAECYHLTLRALLLQQLRCRLDELERGKPANIFVRLFLVRNLARIVSQDAGRDLSEYDIASDQYCKDLALASGRVFAAGSYIVEWNGGIPRSVLYRNGWRQAVAFTRLWSRVRYLEGYLQPHMNKADLSLFTEEGSVLFYYLCGEVLKEHPKLHGVLRVSWLMDPALEQVGKGLVHLSAVPLRHGARRFKYEDDIHGESGALASSPLRRKLFKEGSYCPASYALIWPRKELLHWHSRQAVPSLLSPRLLEWVA